LATLLTVWALSELSSLPGSVYSFLHYADGVSVMSGTAQYLRHHYLISLGFFGCPDRRILFAGDMAVSVWLRCRGVPASDGSPGGERELKLALRTLRIFVTDDDVLGGRCGSSL